MQALAAKPKAIQTSAPAMRAVARKFERATQNRPRRSKPSGLSPSAALRPLELALSVK
jgi:hypothetical protein